MITDKTKPHAIFLDIDGTLMPNGHVKSLKKGAIPPKNIAVIKKAQMLGHKIIINTGRGYSCLPESVFTDIKCDGFIVGLGSMIEIDGKTVYNCPITPGILEEILDFVISHSYPCRFQGKRAAISFDPQTDLSPDWTMIDSKEAFYKALGTDYISKITVDRNLNSEYREFITRRLNLYQTGESGEAASKGCNKALGMQIALEFLGIPRERSIAMGDSINDAEVLLSAGTSVAMANADDKIKEMCDYVTASVVDGGVGQAIEKLLL